MATTFEWNIENIECVLGDDGVTKVAKFVHYTYTATSSEVDSDGNSYQAQAIGPAILDAPSPDTFIDFENLTKQNVIDWILDSTLSTEEELQESLQEGIDEQINPPFISGLPSSWIE